MASWLAGWLGQELELNLNSLEEQSVLYLLSL